MTSPDRPSLAALSRPLVERLLDDAQVLRLGIERIGGAAVVDAGIRQVGGIEAGRRIAELCMGGLGRVTIHADGQAERWPFRLTVHSTDPVLACLGSQYAGWSLEQDEGGKKYMALGSGPGRALARRETALFDDIGYRDTGAHAALVLEVDKMPPEPLIARIAEQCGIDPGRLTLVLTPTQSLAGAVQIVARVLEVALHKVHTLGFPLARVIDGLGTAPLPPPGRNFLEAMGRTNDAILYGGAIQLFVDGPEIEAEDLARRLPSSAARDHGRPFQEIFSHYKGDFYAMDPMLFSPGRVAVTALETGRSFHAGRFDQALLDRCFGHAG